MNKRERTDEKKNESNKKYRSTPNTTPFLKNNKISIPSNSSLSSNYVVSNQQTILSNIEKYKYIDIYNEKLQESMNLNETKEEFQSYYLQLSVNPTVNWIEQIDISQQNANGKLSKGCIDLLGFLRDLSKTNKQFADSYRIEAIATSADCNIFTLSLRINPAKWVTHYLLKLMTEDEAIDIARNYTEEIKNNKKLKIFHEERDPAPITQISKDYCEFQGLCRFLPKCKKHHSSSVCPMRIQKKDGIEHCNWWKTEEFVCFEDQNYIIQVKKGSTRELLMFPTPPKHHSNRILCQDSNFWNSVLFNLRKMSQQCHYRKFPAFGFAFNFGEWESSVSQDPYALNCHGHLHIFLMSEFVDACEQKQKYEMIHRRWGDPEDYYEKDVKLLESNVLISLENKNIRTNMIKMQKKFDKILEKLDSIGIILSPKHQKTHEKKINK